MTVQERPLSCVKQEKIYFISKDKKFGIEKLQEALNIAKEDSAVSYDVLMRTADICRKHETFDISLAMYDEARKVSKEAGDKKREIKALLGLGLTYFLKGDDETSLGVYDKLKTVGEEAGDRGVKIDALFNSAFIYKNHHRTKEALDAYGECLKFYEFVGDRWKTIQTKQEMAKIYEETGDIELAGKFL